jgi:5'-deoxynucleotidase YfbR-like HD superfamily hydrolase
MTQSDLLQAASQLPPQELEDFIAEITAIYRQKQASARSPEEALVETIHRSLSPELQARWDELIRKRDEASLIPVEYDELLELTEQVEELNVQRITDGARTESTRAILYLNTLRLRFTTIATLKLNRDRVVNLRRVLRVTGDHPPVD